MFVMNTPERKPIATKENQSIDIPTDPRSEPTRFGLMDLFALMTLAAFVAATFAPLLRTLEGEGRTRFMTTFVIQLIFIGVAFGNSQRRRLKMLQGSGNRFGMAYCGHQQWRHWPTIKSCIYMIAAAVGQVALALVVASGLSERSFWTFALIYQVQIACFAGVALARFIWRVYPNAVEFFEEGIALRGTVFFPWRRVEIRPSALYLDRLVLVLRPENQTVTAETKMALVGHDLRQRVLQGYQRGRSDAGT